MEHDLEELLERQRKFNEEIAISCHATNLLKKAFQSFYKFYKTSRKRSILYKTILLTQYYLITKKYFNALKKHLFLKKRARKFLSLIQDAKRKQILRICLLEFRELRLVNISASMLSGMMDPSAQNDCLEFSFDPKKGEGINHYKDIKNSSSSKSPPKVLHSEQANILSFNVNENTGKVFRTDPPERESNKEKEILHWYEEDFKKKENLEPRKGRMPFSSKAAEEGFNKGNAQSPNRQAGGDKDKDYLFSQLQEKTALLEFKMSKLSELKKKISIVDHGETVNVDKKAFDDCRDEVKALLSDIKLIKEQVL